jgi:hypothetical protein
MSYAYAVTLLETFLGDTFKALIIKRENFLENAIKNVKEIKNEKYSIFELSKTDLNICSNHFLLTILLLLLTILLRLSIRTHPANALDNPNIDLISPAILLSHIQNEQVEEWIRERLSDKGVGEDSEEWQDLLNQYSDYQEHLQDEFE